MADAIVDPSTTAPASGEQQTKVEPVGEQGLLGTVAPEPSAQSEEKKTVQQLTPAEQIQQELDSKKQQQLEVEAKTKAETDAKAKAEAEAKAKVESEAKAKAEAEAKKVTPEKLKLPENSLIPQERLLEIAKEYAEKNKTIEEAQAFLDGELKTAERIQTFALQKVKSQGEKRLAEIKADPEVGGTKFNDTNKTVTDAVKKVFGEEFLADLKAHGMDTNLKFVKGMARLGANMSPKPMVQGDKITADEKPISPAELAYGYVKGSKPYDPFRVSAEAEAGKQVPQRPRTI